MAKSLVTAEAVAAAAAALRDAGEDPSIIAVQQQIGGGSFTTVKRFLDAWKVAQQSALPEPPPEVLHQANDFARGIWQVASTLASEQVAAAQATATI